MTKDFAVPVLMYHRICDLTPQEARSRLTFDLTVTPANFEAQVRYLKAQGFTFLTARDVEGAIRERAALPVKSVVLTMDDGYQDNFAQAFPILQKYGARATMFLVTDTVETAGHLSWGEVQAMRPQVGYGSHTVHHYDLTQLAPSQLDYELVQSKRVLEGRLGEAVPDIAYPSGAYNDQVVARTRAAGYLAGWKKGGGPATPTDEPLLLPRVRVRGCTTVARFRQMVWSGVSVQRDHTASRLARSRTRRARPEAA
ncbi:MAG: polysaccharide deacetylase family protein [Armatimonadetes bacterium]|nr:polysaccharide deacetylase family protein [Armatimonadota bacterium]